MVLPIRGHQELSDALKAEHRETALNHAAVGEEIDRRTSHSGAQCSKRPTTSSQGSFLNEQMPSVVRGWGRKKKVWVHRPGVRQAFRVAEVLECDETAHAVIDGNSGPAVVVRSAVVA